jgi:penicillin-binding protein 1A
VSGAAVPADGIGRTHRWLPDWRHPKLRWFIALGVVGLIVVVPPLRRAVSNVTSRLIFLVVAPLAPAVTDFHAVPQATVVLAADGRELGRIDGIRGNQPVKLAALPPWVKQSVLAAEDADFYHHAGIDPAALGRAALGTLRGSRQGGSTITQQVAKLDYTGSSRTVLRKLREALYAERLEQHYSKNEILEHYLNEVYFGDGVYGLGTAAQVYFGVTADKLTPAQAATLAGKIHAPVALDPYHRPDRVTARRNEVLRAMAHHGWLDHAQLESAVAAPMVVAAAPPPAVGAYGRFLADVQREALRLNTFGGSAETKAKHLFTGGYVIRTTLDPKAFDASLKAVSTRLGAPGDPTAAIASVAPGDGAIRVLFGGIDPNQSFDAASQARRQPGSSFKPFVYLAALRSGIDPRRQFDSSSPKTLRYQGDAFQVTNYDGTGKGPMTVDDALVHSVNTVYAQLGLAVGPQKVVDAARDDGIAEKISPVPAVSLGGLNHGVSPLDMAAAYATFAARGVYATPYSVSAIADRHGHVVYKHRPKTHQAFDRVQVAVLNRALERVVGEGTGTAANIGRPVAGKTGTTSQYTDGWFVGYVPQLATAVWVGHPNGSVPMKRVHGIAVTGGSFPAQIFAEEMRTVLAGVPVVPLETATPDQLGLTPPTSSSSTSSSSSSSTSTSDSLPALSTDTPPPPAPFDDNTQSAPVTSQPASPPPTRPATTTTSTSAPPRATTTTTTSAPPHRSSPQG